MTSASKAHISRGQALTITLGGIVITYLLWNVALLEPVAYPLRLFVTYVHEAGHSMMALLTGGQVIQFTVSPNGAGLATTSGGSRALILPAGYLGAAFFGAALFAVIHLRPSFSRFIAGGLGLSLVIFTLLYARPDSGGAPTAILVGLAMGLGLMASSWKLDQRFNLLLLSVLAIMTSLHAVFDITNLVGYADACIITQSGRELCNDAAAFSKEIAPILPAAFWALLWAALSILMTGGAVYYSVIRPLLTGDKPRKGSGQRAKHTANQDDDLVGLKRTADGDIDWSQF